MVFLSSFVSVDAEVVDEEVSCVVLQVSLVRACLGMFSLTRLTLEDNLSSVPESADISSALPPGGWVSADILAVKI